MLLRFVTPQPRFRKAITFGWQVHCTFQVYQHRDYEELLQELVMFFGCGKVRSKGPSSDVLTYAVDSLAALESKIVPFFEHYPPRVKFRDFLLFADIVGRLRNKEHFSVDGLVQIVRLAYSMNANGKQRARSVEEVIEGILRDCTPSLDLPIE